MKKVVIATRGSQLALWQAEHIKSRLMAQYEGLEVELLILKTKGDIILDVPLAKVGGKGLFVKEIEEALLAGTADLAVHSMKDVPMVLPEGLTLGAGLADLLKGDGIGGQVGLGTQGHAFCLDFNAAALALFTLSWVSFSLAWIA